MDKKAERIQTSLLNAAEKKALVWLANRQPRWVSSDMLTWVGTFGSVLIALGYILSHLSVNWLWLSTFGLIVNWYGDSLDGTLARVRKTQRPIYGYYIDHTVDGINETLMFAGIGLSPFLNLYTALAMLVVYLHALDYPGLVILAILLLIYFVTIARDIRYYAKIDPMPKHKDE